MTEDLHHPIKYFQRRNRMKAKLTGGVKGAFEIDREALAKVQAVFESASEDYPDWVTEQIESLRQLHAAIAGGGAAANRALARMATAATELKGQGLTFGFPLVTDFAASLCDAISGSAKPTPPLIELIKAHLNAIASVISSRVRGDGGATGEELKANLAQAIEKHANARLKT